MAMHKKETMMCYVYGVEEIYIYRLASAVCTPLPVTVVFIAHLRGTGSAATAFTNFNFVCSAILSSPPPSLFLKHTHTLAVSRSLHFSIQFNVVIRRVRTVIIIKRHKQIICVAFR